MSLEILILRDLAAGQTTADSLAGRLKKHPEAIAQILTRLESQKQIISLTIMDRLTVYKLPTHISPCPSHTPSPASSI
jgi:hypothetical protein